MPIENAAGALGVIGMAGLTIYAIKKTNDCNNMENKLNTSLRVQNNTQNKLISSHKEQIRDNQRMQLVKQGELKENQSELDNVNEKIKIATKALQNHNFEKEINGTKLLMLIGETGSGKSTFGNRLCGDTTPKGNKTPFKIGVSNSCTVEVQKHYFNVISKIKQNLRLKNSPKKSFEYAVLDTPGLNDSKRCDSDYINKIIKWLNGCGGINAFVLVISLETCRPITGGTIKALETYEKRLTKDFWNYTFVILTGCDSLNKTDFEERKKTVGDELNKFSKNLKFISSGHKSYKIAIDKLLKNMKNKKFNNKDLKAPIHDLIDKQNILTQKIRKINGDIATIQQRIDDLNNQL